MFLSFHLYAAMGQSTTVCLPLADARSFRASPAIRRDFLTEKVLSPAFFQIPVRLYCFPISPLSIPFEPSISGKGPHSSVLKDIHSVKYFTCFSVRAHTGQCSYCRDFLYEPSALYTFETLEKFHLPRQTLLEILVGT